MESTSSIESVEIKFLNGAELKSPPPNVVPDNSILRTSLQKRLQSTTRLEPIEKSKIAHRRAQQKKYRDYSPVLEKPAEVEKPDTSQTSATKLISIKRLVLPEKHRPLINVDFSDDEEFDSAFLNGPSVHQPFIVNSNAIEDDFGLDLTVPNNLDGEEEIDLTNGDVITEELELIPPEISVKDANKGCLSICDNFANFWCSVVDRFHF